jgi:hypothetical protein
MKNVDHKVDAHAKLLQTLLADLFQALREISTQAVIVLLQVQLPNDLSSANVQSSVRRNRQ